MATTGLPAEQAVPEPDEQRRLQALHRYGVLDQPPAPSLEGLTRIAAALCGVSASVINLMDEQRQVMAAAQGTTPALETPREASLCTRILDSRTVTYSPDLRVDARFSDNPHVTGELASWRTYAAAPLLTPDNLVIGTLCVFDEEPRELTALQLRTLADLAGQVVALFELRRYAEQVREAASHDSLTGLPNRVILEGQMAHALAVAARRHGRPVVLVLDLNGFKAVNDTYGHEAGDEVLRAVANRIHRAVRLEDTAARLSGDEFAVVLDDPPPGMAEEIVARLRAAICQPVRHHGAEVSIEAAVGAATARPVDDVTTWLARADLAMYADKARRAG